MAGRPTDYTSELVVEICSRLAEGESLNRICRDDDMPCKMSVYRWLKEHADFLELYISARNDQADTLADEIIDIADETTAVDLATQKDSSSETSEMFGPSIPIHTVKRISRSFRQR